MELRKPLNNYSSTSEQVFYRAYVVQVSLLLTLTHFYGVPNVCFEQVNTGRRCVFHGCKIIYKVTNLESLVKIFLPVCFFN